MERTKINPQGTGWKEHPVNTCSSLDKAPLEWEEKEDKREVRGPRCWWLPMRRTLQPRPRPRAGSTSTWNLIARGVLSLIAHVALNERGLDPTGGKLPDEGVLAPTVGQKQWHTQVAGKPRLRRASGNGWILGNLCGPTMNGQVQGHQLGWEGPTHVPRHTEAPWNRCNLRENMGILT